MKNMYQHPPRASVQTSSALSIHRAVHYNNTKGWKTPLFYEKLNFEIVQKNRRADLLAFIANNQENSHTAYRYKIKPGDHGIGSQIHLMMGCFSKALHEKKAFEIQGNWIFAGDRPFTDLFQPLQHNANKLLPCPPSVSTKLHALPSFSDFDVFNAS